MNKPEKEINEKHIKDTVEEALADVPDDFEVESNGKKYTKDDLRMLLTTREQAIAFALEELNRQELESPRRPKRNKKLGWVELPN